MLAGGPQLLSFMSNFGGAALSQASRAVVARNVASTGANHRAQSLWMGCLAEAMSLLHLAVTVCRSGTHAVWRAFTASLRVSTGRVRAG
jgi:hypothetical protein